MKNFFARLALAAALGSLLTSVQLVLAQGTAFTYQGQLSATGSPANGNYDFTFALFNNNSTNTGQAGSTLTNLDVGVTNGLFIVTLDFGGVFSGANYWLAIGVRSNGGASFTALNPLQAVTPTPYAIYSPNAGTAANVTGSVSLSQLPAAVLTNNDTNVNLSGAFSGNGAGITNVPGTMPVEIVSGVTQTASANQAYLLTNNAFSTVTLPVSTNVGDIVTVSGVGSNGWQVLPGLGQTIAGYGGSPGVIWTVQLTSDEVFWQSVASSSDGTHLVTVGLSLMYDSGTAWTSINSGTNWTDQFNGSENLFCSVASSSDGTKLVAVVDGGPIYTSINSGTNWTAQNSGSQYWQSVASSSDGTKLVTVVYGGQINTSIDSGTNWTAQNSGSQNWQSVASSSDGTKLVAIVYGGQIYTSIDSGTNWTAQNSGSQDWWSVASSSDGTKLVAAVENGGQIYTSINSGTNWTAQNSGSQNWYSVASSSDGTKLVAAVFGGQIYTSTNSGTNWTAQNSGSQDWWSVASSSDGTKLVAVAEDQIDISDEASPAFGGVADTTAQFQYIGNGAWQPLTISASLVSGAITNTQSGVTLSGTFNGTFNGNGSGLTSLNASQLSSGTVPLSALPSDLAALSINNGANLTNLNAASLTTGILSQSVLPANAALLNRNQVFSGSTNSFTGNVGIGTTNPAAQVQISGNYSTNNSIGLAVAGINNGGSLISLEQIGLSAWAVGMLPDQQRLSIINNQYPGNAGTEVVSVLTGGSVGIGTTNPTYTLQVNGSVAGTSAYQNVSDARYKTNITRLTHALDKIMALRGVEYDWRSNAYPQMKFDQGTQLGFVAQEIKDVLPEVVSQDANGYYSIAYSKVIPVLVEAIKDQQREMENQQKATKKEMKEKADKVDSLEKQNDSLAARLNDLEAEVKVLAEKK